jgi:hypothetical protein
MFEPLKPILQHQLTNISQELLTKFILVKLLKLHIHIRTQFNNGYVPIKVPNDYPCARYRKTVVYS